jgi:Tat protein secretion system quality control protein TatD with DNase activity
LAKENENLLLRVSGFIQTECRRRRFSVKKTYEKLLGEKTICVGECGLDYFRGRRERGPQEIEFRKQIDFALENDLPLMLHIRPKKGTMDAYEDTLEILEEYKKTAGEKLRGQAHFFAGT